jgi:hypothetical protein
VRRVAFALQFLGAIVVLAVAIVVYVSMHAPDTTPDEPELPDGNSRGDDLLTWAAQHPDRTHAPEYLEDQW